MLIKIKHDGLTQDGIAEAFAKSFTLCNESEKLLQEAKEMVKREIRNENTK